MANVHERLRAVGLRIDAGHLRPEVGTECTRLARVLQQKNCRVVGVAPAGDGVAVPAVALQLGLALARVSGSPVGVVDAHGSWPSSQSLVGSTRPDPSLFATYWIVDNLALLTPRTFDIGAMLFKLNNALHAEAQVFQYLVIDMTGFDHLGEHLSAIALMDGVIVVARSGHSTLDDLTRWMRDVPGERNLGVLLVGA